MTTKNLLRDAVASVQPKVALNLPKNHKFSPPVPNAATLSGTTGEQSTQATKPDGWAEKEPQGLNQPQAQKSTPAEKRPRVGNVPSAASETEPEPVNASDEAKVPQGLTPTEGSSLDQGGNIPPDIEEHQASETSPDSQETMDEEEEEFEKGISSEEKFRKAFERLRTGSSYISNNFLMELIHGDHSKAEIKIALLTARFTYGFQGRLSAKLSKRVIERYTKLKGSTVLEAERALDLKKVVKKIPGDKLTSSRLQIRIPTIPWNGPPKSKAPTRNTDKQDGKSPQGTKGPQDQKADHPGGQNNTQPRGKKGDHPQGPKSTPFKKESSNQSLKSYLSKNSDLPEEMILRWKALDENQNDSILEKEIKVYDSLLSEFGENFRNLCVAVVSFLETRGVERQGKIEKIHNGLLYLENHWEYNLGRYLDWDSSNTSKARAKASADEADKAKATENRKREEAEIIHSGLLASFTTVFPDDGARTQLIETVVAQSGISQVQSSWERLGWDSPMVQNYVLDLFSKNPEDIGRLSQGSVIEEVSA